MVALAPFLKIIGAFLWEYRNIVAAFLLAASLVMYGYKWGSDSVQAEWDESVRLQKELIQVEKERLQSEINEKSLAYEKLKNKMRAKNEITRRNIEDEISKTPSLRNCIATPGFVRYYKDSLYGEAGASR